MKASNKQLERVVRLFDIITEKRNGNRARQLIKSIAKYYEHMPMDIYSHLQEDYDEKVKAVLSSAYGMSKGGSLSFCERLNYGGWGITLDTSRKGLELKDNQFWFAKLSGDALGNSILSGESGKYVDSSKNSLEYSTVSGNALENSKHTVGSLSKAIILDGLKNAELGGGTLSGAKVYSGLDGAQIYEKVLDDIERYGEPLKNIIIIKKVKKEKKKIPEFDDFF